MAYTNGKLPGLNFELVQGYIEPVYRYHLARCENYLEAQNLTVQTLTTALKWIDTYHTGPDRLKTWVMEIACDRQSAGRRQSIATLKRLPGATISPSLSTAPTLDHDPLPPEQGEILLRNRMSHLSSSWNRLPAKQADALALYFFGGLSLEEVGALLHKPKATVSALVARESAFEVDLFELADSIHPGKDLLSWLKEELARPAAPHLSWLPHWLNFAIWTPSYPVLRSFFSIGARLSQVGLLVAVLGIGFYMIQRQSVVPLGRVSTPTPSPLTGMVKVGGRALAQLPPAPVDNPGNLVPPAASVCQEWQAALAGVVDQQDITLSNVVFDDPTAPGSTQPGSGARGTGCLLETTVINRDLHGAWATFDNVSELLLAKNFNELADAGSPGQVNTDYFDPGCSGLGRTFESSANHAILTVNWCSDVESITGTGTPNPMDSGPNIALDLGGGVPLPGGLRPYILKLALASNAMDSFLNSLFSQWSTGSQQVITYLAPTLQTRFSNLKALDRLAGITSLSTQKMSFSWQVLDNSGSNLRILVQVYESTGLEANANPKTQFQMALTQENGAWTIQQLGKTVQFSS